MMKVTYKNLTSNIWPDFEMLFGEKGACGGCWCMYWRLRNKDFEKGKGAGNKKAMKKLVKKGKQIGLIMYINDIPAGWCSVAPREDFVRMETSRILKPVDNNPVWSVVCFFIHKDYRKQGYSVKMLKEVATHCKRLGAKIVEGYPVEPKHGEMPPAFAWTGIAAAFRKAGFKEVARRSETRPVMRCSL
jgi:GNAT superfamily N-acetyltransferase